MTLPLAAGLLIVGGLAAYAYTRSTGALGDMQPLFPKHPGGIRLVATQQGGWKRLPRRRRYL